MNLPPEMPESNPQPIASEILIGVFQSDANVVSSAEIGPDDAELVLFGLQKAVRVQHSDTTPHDAYLEGIKDTLVAKIRHEKLQKFIQDIHNSDGDTMATVNTLSLWGKNEDGTLDTLMALEDLEKISTDTTDRLQKAARNIAHDPEQAVLIYKALCSAQSNREVWPEHVKQVANLMKAARICNTTNGAGDDV